MTDTQPGTEQEYADLLGEFETALLVTRGPDGHFHARPMATQQKSRRDGIWFATYGSSDKCREIAADPQVAIAYHEGKRDATYLSISGRAEIVRDRDQIEELWDPSWKPWFPDGPEEEDLVLIHVVPEHAEWVRPAGGRLKVWKTMAKRALTGAREAPGQKKGVDLG